LPKGDVNSTWSHDLYESHNSLSARLGNSAPPKKNFSAAEKALLEATGGGISIKGASQRGNVVEVSGLADGTTSEDVEAIFKRCGPITTHKAIKTNPVVVRLVFKSEKDAQAAVSKFNGQPADGRTLVVKVVGGANATLGGRLGAAAVDDSVDVLMEDSGSKGSKLRSDEILATDARARVQVAPPGANLKDYVPQQRSRGGRGRGRGRGGRRGGGGGGASRMDIDN